MLIIEDFIKRFIKYIQYLYKFYCSFYLNEHVILAFYKLSLDITYFVYQKNMFHIYDYHFDFNLFRYFIGWIFFILGLYAVKKTNVEKMSLKSLLIITIYSLSIIPFIVMYQFDYNIKSWMVVLQLICLEFLRIFMQKIKWKWLSSLKVCNYRSSLFRKIILGIIVLSFFYFFDKFGIPQLSNFMFANVYSVRSSIQYSYLEAQLLNFFTRIIFPFIIIIGMIERKISVLIVAFLLEVYLYSVTGSKTILFISLLIIVLQLLPFQTIREIVISGLPLVVVITDLIYFFTGNIMTYAVIINRVFFLPAKIKYCYLDFFSKNDFIYFSQNTFAKLLGIASNYSIDIPHLIGDVYFQKPNMWANVGFMVDAFSNAGIIGMLIASIILGSVVSLADFSIENIPLIIKKGIQSLFLLFFIALNDGAVIYIMFSGGLCFLVFLLIFLDFNLDKGC